MKKHLLILLAITFFFVGNAQKRVFPLPMDSTIPIKGNTICYMLPTTGFKITVSITKVREIKGYYTDYAEQLLGLTNIISENRTFYKVGNVAIEPIQLPDFNQAYLVEFSKDQIKKGIPTTLNKNTPFIPELGNGGQCYTTATTPVPNFFKNYSDPTFAEMEDTFVETKIIDGVVTQVPANRTKLVSKTNNQKAQEAADAISKSRKNQYDLVAGEQETAYSVETMATMLKELNQWEENYLSLFTGIILEDEILYTFYVIPENAGKCPLFSFDQTNGLSLDNMNGENIYQLILTPILNTQIDRLENDLPSKNQNTKKKTEGYRYRKPMPVQVKLSVQGKEIHDFGIFNMSQFGTVRSLSSEQNQLDINQFGFVY